MTVVAAGTSDAPVAAEAALTARVHGAGVHAIGDVGVAGLHRLLDVRDELRGGRLPDRRRRHGGRPARAWSAGSSASRSWRCRRRVGYGASFGGLAALLAMLNSCAPGVTVVNIDNGYGAGVLRRPGGPQRRAPHHMRAP